MRSEKAGQVYFIETEDGQFVKIGYSTRVKVRLSELGTLRPGSFSLRVIGSIPGTPAVERWLHQQFIDDRDNGEWFRKTPRVCAFLETLTLTPPIITERPKRRRKAPKRRALLLEPEVDLELEPETLPNPKPELDTTEAPIPEVIRLNPTKLPPYLTIPEKDRLFRVIQSPRDRAIFRLLYHHGLRASEIGKLELSHYRPGSTLELDRIYINRLKGSISGEHPVVPAAAQPIRAWLRKRGHRAGPLFPTRLGTAISRKWIYDLMRKYCAAADIPKEKSHPHCLKHTCCTHLISDQKESIMDVRTHVGHVNIRNTMTYAELMPEASEARAKRLRGWK